jgi:redox-sensing transcriptional repressor
LARLSRTARADHIPDVVVDRLPLYARALAILQAEGQEVVSSAELGERLRVTPAQIRKDLSYFGRFGKQGRGYDVELLLQQLRVILGLDRQWRMALVGVGKLGRAILEYGGFAPQGFIVTQAFDVDPELVAQKMGDITVRHVSELEEALSRDPVDIGIVAVPAAAAQKVIDALVNCKIKAILTYAPISARAPSDVEQRRVDPMIQLQRMTFRLKDLGQPAKRGR